ncbi:MAG: SHOCT domain-containing protein [Deltaproteobacteria bacterium]|nr:MAG: SHOCT domain-containing protein [Deltaproteobacteria bacterium]
MYWSEVSSGSLWWIFPLAMIALCFFMLRKRGGSMCGFGSRDEDNKHISDSDSASDILDKRYALGEISKEEYEEKKITLSRDK